MSSSRDAILEALRTRSLPEASECDIWGMEDEWDCLWPPNEDPAMQWWGEGITPAAAHSAMIEKIEHALKESE